MGVGIVIPSPRRRRVSSKLRGARICHIKVIAPYAMEIARASGVRVVAAVTERRARDTAARP
jgi:hypothetical protein